VAQAYSGDDRRRPELKDLREAMEQSQALWRRLAGLSPHDPKRPELVAKLDRTQSRVMALRLKHRL